LQGQGHCCNPTNNSGGSPPTTSIAIATAGDFADSDWNGFQAQYNYLAWFYHRVWIDGTPSCCNDETTLDMEWAIATANSFGSYQATSQVWVYEGANNLLSTFTDAYNQMLSDGNARVFSTSWGCAELTCASGSSMDTDHAIFDSMLGQGWTIMALSHDYGATGGCDAADRVTYPGSEPDAVSVGGTSLALFNDGTFDFETAWEGATYSGACSHNAGGSGGGCSAHFAAPGYQTNPACGSASRSVPDISLNAGYGQNYYFSGALRGVGGTSISTPQVAGFMAQENAYLLSLGSICGVNNGTLPCAPMGQADYPIYYEGYTGNYAPHFPFYDILVGCNNNDVTATYSLGYYCAGTGYDAITGWGSFNALQLAWAINWSTAADTGRPYVVFAGPTTGQWYNTDQVISWNVYDSGGGTYPATGVAGFTQAWDFDPGDPSSESTQGVGNPFYSGPQYPNATAGCLDFTGGFCAGSVGQGWHTVNVRAWDNMGFGSGDATYGPIGYDTVPPITTDTLSGTFNGSVFTTPVTVTLSATDPSPGSGVAATIYQLGANPPQNYGGPFTISSTGFHSLNFHSTDVAGNVESSNVVQVHIEAPTTTTLTSSTNPSSFHQPVTFTAKVAGSFGATPVGSVTFKNGGVAMGGAVALSGGIAKFTISTITVGSHSITASYGGSGANLASVSATLTQKVNKASTTTTIASSINPSSFNQSVTFTATVHRAFGGTATGTVTFKDGSTVIGTRSVSSSGIATLSTTALTVAVHSITASYGGDGNFLTSVSSPLAQTVKKANTKTTLSSSLNPSHHGNAVTFTAKVLGAFGGAPLGTVTFKDGTTVLGTGTVNATTHLATFTTSTLTVGTHPITAVYHGSAKFNSSVSAIVNQVVNP
jgi:hypothetical protein